MGIQIDNAVSVPAITYNKIYMTKLEIIQPVIEDDVQAPKYQVVISYRHYGVGADSKRYFYSEDLQRIAVDDFYALAMADAGSGDMTMINALQSIEAAVAAIIGDQTGANVSVA